MLVTRFTSLLARCCSFLSSCQPVFVFVTGVLALFFAGSVHANGNVSSQYSALAESSDWRNLLHIPAGSTRSEIENHSFFLAEDGRTNALAELHATIALLQLPHADNNEHPQCQYPARFFWLQQQGLLGNVAPASCNEFHEWAETAQLRSASLIFADGFLGNPASFYGHLLLKNNAGSDAFASDLLNNSMNFGAAVADTENPVVYILKGLLGGYQATYSASHFYRYNLNYAEAELRDLWDYELNVSPDQAYLLSAHNWELLNTAYTYYFTHRNCAYHIGRTLELVTDEPLMSRYEPFVFPIAVVQRLAASTINGEPAVTNIRHIESRQSRFRRKFLQLDSAEQIAARSWVDSAGSDRYAYSILTEASRKRVLSVLVDYYEFLISQDSDDQQPKELKNQVLLARMQLPAGAVPFAPSAANPPHTAVGGSLLQPRAVHNSELGAAVELTYRVAYYDMLTPDAGKAADSALSMGELSLRWQAGEGLDVAKFWAVNIESMSINPTGLTGDGGRAWLVRAGWQRDYLAATGQQLRAFVRGGLGKAWQHGDSRVYTMLDSQISGRDGDGNWLEIMPRAGFTHSFGATKVLCETGVKFGNESNRWSHRCDARLTHRNNWDVRVGIAREDYTEVSAAFSFYF